MGVTAPNGIGLQPFERSLREGISGITLQPKLQELNFRCQIAGKPEVTEEILKEYFTTLELRSLKSSGIIYGIIAGLEAWKDAGLETLADEVHWDDGMIFGTGILGVDKFREAIHLIDQKNCRRLGSTSVVQTMASGITSFLNNRLACGNQVTANSSACTTGTEAILMALERIRSGRARRMLAGSAGESGPYIWGGFDAMRITPAKYNQNPEEASRPMSESAAGIVPGSGAGALVLEEMESARARGARIYAEVLGGCINSGGQRNGGSQTAPNQEGVRRCIVQALKDAGTSAEEIDTINGHLTATSMDAAEIRSWFRALGLNKEKFPYVNSLKSLTGHCLSAAGSIESIASILQLSNGYVFGNKNSRDLHPDIKEVVGTEKVPQETLSHPVKKVAKASFGFGDVNAVVVFGKI